VSYASKLKQFTILTLLVLIISGCQGLPIPDLALVAPITNVGDEAEAITNIDNGPSTFWMLLCIIGWMAPSPNEIFRSVANFILKLFGRN